MKATLQSFDVLLHFAAFPGGLKQQCRRYEEVIDGCGVVGRINSRQRLFRAVVVNSNMSHAKYLTREGPGSRLPRNRLPSPGHQAHPPNHSRHHQHHHHEAEGR